MFLFYYYWEAGSPQPTPLYHETSIAFCIPRRKGAPPIRFVKYACIKKDRIPDNGSPSYCFRGASCDAKISAHLEENARAVVWNLIQYN